MVIELGPEETTGDLELLNTHAGNVAEAKDLIARGINQGDVPHSADPNIPAVCRKRGNTATRKSGHIGKTFPAFILELQRADAKASGCRRVSRRMVARSNEKFAIHREEAAHGQMTRRGFPYVLAGPVAHKGR